MLEGIKEAWLSIRGPDNECKSEPISTILFLLKGIENVRSTS